jgi:large repetitive protein
MTSPSRLSPSHLLLRACVVAALAFAFSAPVASGGDTFTLLKDIHVGTDADGRPLGSYPSRFARVGPWVYFTANATTDWHNLRLWRTDGTPEGTAEVPGSPVPYYGFTAVGSDMFFVGSDAYGDEVWKLDAAGTLARLTDINPGAGGSQVAYLTEFKGELYFRASNGSRYGLWKVGQGGVEEVKPLYPAYYAGPYELTVLNDHLFFAAFSSDLMLHLWRTDGTKDGTLAVGPPRLAMPAAATEIATFNGALFFLADDLDDPGDGMELWTSDGNPENPAGTHIVKDLYPGYSGPPGSYNRTVNSSAPTQFTEMNGALYFVAESGLGPDGEPCGPLSADCRYLGRELWKTDGTAEGTVLVRNISELGSSQPWNFTISGGLLFFTADDGIVGRELWRSDGTEAGTRLVADVCSLDPAVDQINACGVAPSVAQDLNPSSSNPGALTDVRGRLYFAAYDKEHGRELFRTNAAADGVELVTDLYPGASFQYMPWLCGSTEECYLPHSSLDVGGPSGSLPVLDGKLILSADDGQSGFEPWVFRSLTPAEEISELVETVNGLIAAETLKLGQGKSLVGKLELALYMLEYDNTKKAITMLEAFIQEVEAFKRGGVLDGLLADDLIASAQSAITSLAG